MGIPVNTSIDPTNAIVIGAAYFAGTKEKSKDIGQVKQTISKLKIRASYNKSSQEREETFSAKIEGELNGLQYRMLSESGSFDSGLKKLSLRIGGWKIG